ncbi:cytochrome C oxidase subunit IV family protein [Crenobacter sp. SG2303]|uniref:Cytochrome C oxidase subunit IV family protein n=1 Tax=Crenobacter oryzisoli TaxID=3056844 RepID=A0ABT7XN58_9NEIS|nr:MULTISPECIES: cytochrome C oxidase subunit IV family protein [unclassified Crenobacter]MDN0075224.1 cytochrome C oxidase subunit IV family protein [Crenobacter sp. SG2303]MDN0082814.1 cytochrome C oxidase subunit IV family protein [Crenobacter sp. SG2305]
MSAQHTHPGGHASGQQHPISLYLKVWGMLFVLSTFSYLVDYFNIQGFLRWFLIVAFMLMKAGLIIGVFMHMRWERLALMVAILLPPLCLMVLIGMMQAEARYTYSTRGQFFSNAPVADSTKAKGGGTRE